MLVFFIILVLIIMLVYLSGINIQINQLEIERNNKMKLKDFKIDVYLLLFNKIKILKISINKEQIEKINFNKILDRFKGKSLKQDRNIVIDSLRELKIKVEEIQINAKLGLSDAVFLSYLIAVINIVLSIIYVKIAKDNKKNYRYKIEPYQTINFYLKLSINCIINLKIVNIINIIIKNRSDVKNERTSNRIVNGNSYG